MHTRNVICFLAVSKLFCNWCPLAIVVIVVLKGWQILIECIQRDRFAPDSQQQCNQIECVEKKSRHSRIPYKCVKPRVSKSTNEEKHKSRSRTVLVILALDLNWNWPNFQGNVFFSLLLMGLDGGEMKKKPKRRNTSNQYLHLILSDFFLCRLMFSSWIVYQQSNGAIVYIRCVLLMCACVCLYNTEY